jgi:hypothetical protein
MKKIKLQPVIYLLSLLLVSILISCNNEVENLEDLREVSLEENPTLINGLRLGVINDLHDFKSFGIMRRTRSSIPFYCAECEIWRGFEEGQMLDELFFADEHSYRDILRAEEGFWNLYSQEEVYTTDKSNVVYVREGGRFVRKILSNEEDDALVYVDAEGNNFEQKEPFTYFEGLKKMVIMRSSSFPKGVFANTDLLVNEGKDTILTEMTLNFYSTNNAPLTRLVYDLEDGILYVKGQVVDIEVDNFERLYDDCNEAYFIALNEFEVNKIINFFEDKFGKKEYKTKNCSGDFNRPERKSFYREYRWSVGIVNITLQIHDFQPVNITGLDSKNPYVNQKGYGVIASFKLNDQVNEIIRKEN